ncbi:hypothetical protein ACMFMG_004376 [Clarireedia jacksonii]
MPFTTRVEKPIVPRYIVHTQNDFHTTIEKLYSSIGHPEGRSGQTMQEITTFDKTSKEAYTVDVEKKIGPHGFIIFEEFDHGCWYPIYLPSHPKLQLKRVIFGNPLIAITMIQHDLTAGLSVPIQMLVQEKTEEDGGGCDLVYFLPSALIAGERGNQELEKAARVLDEKLAALVDWLVAV